MSHVSDFLTPAELQKVANLQVVARLVVEGFFSGLHKSPHKGFSVEFAQHRQYVQGDEIRRLDWKVFGKTDRYYVREYEEETNLRATLLLDLSGSMSYAGAGRAPKADYAIRLAAALAYLMLQQRDSVGLVTFDTKIRRYIPPRSSVPHLRVLLDELQSAQPGGETALGGVFHDLVPRIQRRGLLIVLSDCFGDPKELLKALAHFRHARHEILIFQILDRDELDFPFTHWTRFESLETAGAHRMIDPAQFRAAYLDNLKKFQDELTKGCHRHRIDLVQMVTDQPYAEALAQYLTQRLARG
jgi:uncharacterized protein (DUF58 family)